MISTKGRYALRIMIDLASQDPESFIPLKDIAERQCISKKYLEIIIKDLVEGGLLISLSGKGGGYKLKRKPEEYTIGEILDLKSGHDGNLLFYSFATSRTASKAGFALRSAVMSRG